MKSDEPPRRTVLPADFDRAFEEMFPSLFRYCLRLLGDVDAAEDVTQEAFTRLYERKVEGPRAAVRVWLFRVATHLIRDRHRLSENRRRLLEVNPVLPGSFQEPDAALEQKETVATVRAVLDRLPERDRTMLLMREEGFSYREIAEAVGIQAASVGTLLARAQQRFVEHYQGQTAGGS